MGFSKKNINRAYSMILSQDVSSSRRIVVVEPEAVGSYAPVVVDQLAAALYSQKAALPFGYLQKSVALENHSVQVVVA